MAARREARFKVGQKLYEYNTGKPCIVINGYANGHAWVYKVVLLDKPDPVEISEIWLHPEQPRSIPNVSRPKDEDYPEGNAPGSQD